MIVVAMLHLVVFILFLINHKSTSALSRQQGVLITVYILTALTMTIYLIVVELSRVLS